MILMPTTTLIEVFGLKNFKDFENSQFSYEDNQPRSDLLKSLLAARAFGDQLNFHLLSEKISLPDELEKSPTSFESTALAWLCIEAGLLSAHQDSDSHEKQVKIITTYLDNQPGNVELLTLAFLSLLYAGAYERCDAILERLAAEPSHVDMSHRLNFLSAFKLFQMGRYSESAEALQKSVDSGAVNLGLYGTLCVNFLSYFYIQNGDIKEAHDLLNRFRELISSAPSFAVEAFVSNSCHVGQFFQDDAQRDRLNDHYNNVFRHSSSHESKLFDALKQRAYRLFQQETYESFDTYGVDTVRFSNSAANAWDYLSRYIFIASMYGSYSGQQAAEDLRHQLLYGFGKVYRDQKLFVQSAISAVTTGEKKTIDRVLRSPDFSKSRETISLLTPLLSEETLRGPVSNGVSHLIKNIHAFLDDDQLSLALRHLISQIQRGMNFSSSIDYARPALACVGPLSHICKDVRFNAVLAEFSKFVSTTKPSLISVDEMNKVILQLDNDNSSGTNLALISVGESYELNLEKFISIHYESTLLSAAILAKAVPSNESLRRKLLEIVTSSFDESETKASRRLFLFSVLFDVEQEAALRRELMFVAAAKEYLIGNSSLRREYVTSFDPIDSVGQVFSRLTAAGAEEICNYLVTGLTNEGYSISTRNRIIRILIEFSSMLSKSQKQLILDFYSNSRQSLFDAGKGSPFFSAELPVYRAFLLVLVTKISPLSLELLTNLVRSSVSSEVQARRAFLSGVLALAEDLDGQWSALLSLRCYELSFDEDPVVRGRAGQAMMKLIQPDTSLWDQFSHRFFELSKDTSELTRANCSYLLSKYHHKHLPAFSAVAEELAKDLSFYVRKNLSA